MRRKLAKMVGKEYVEWEENEGPTHPSTQEDKVNEQNDLSIRRLLDIPNARGMRVA